MNASSLSRKWARVIGRGEVAADAGQTGSIGRFFHHWFRRETVTRAIKVACVVGPTLTIINQHDVLLNRQFSPRLFAKILLTFFVPYCVSSSSSTRAYMEDEAKLHGRERLG